MSGPSDTTVNSDLWRDQVREKTGVRNEHGSNWVIMRRRRRQRILCVRR